MAWSRVLKVQDMEVVRQRSIEVLGGEAQAVHRTAEWSRGQWEGLQRRKVWECQELSEWETEGALTYDSQAQCSGPGAGVDSPSPGTPTPIDIP